jgi:hypothetical protein
MVIKGSKIATAAVSIKERKRLRKKSPIALILYFRGNIRRNFWTVEN